MTPALGTPGEPGPWERASEGAPVALHIGEWRDGRWSYLFKEDTDYAPADAESDGMVAAVARRQRGGREVPVGVVGPIIHEPVWTWEVPLYFWFGGMASGASFVALACEVAGDRHSARTARRVALAAVLPSPVLLIMDLGRPERFLHMLRVFKPRSPMSMGAWCLVAFSNFAAAGVAFDVFGLDRAARYATYGATLTGEYLGSYTGVLLATTAVPLWDRSRLLLGPVFVATATATGAAATRLALVATGLPAGHPTRRALGRVEAGAMAVELILSDLNERRLGDLRPALEEGSPGKQFRAAKGLVVGGLLAQGARRFLGRRSHDAASVMYLAAALLFRFAWVGAGKQSARDDLAVAKAARGRATVEDRLRR
jgi:hypothetical protein